MQESQPQHLPHYRDAQPAEAANQGVPRFDNPMPAADRQAVMNLPPARPAQSQQDWPANSPGKPSIYQQERTSHGNRI